MKHIGTIKLISVFFIIALMVSLIFTVNPVEGSTAQSHSHVICSGTMTFTANWQEQDTGGGSDQAEVTVTIPFSNLDVGVEGGKSVAAQGSYGYSGSFSNSQGNGQASYSGTGEIDVTGEYIDARYQAAVGDFSGEPLPSTTDCVCFDIGGNGGAWNTIPEQYKQELLYCADGNYMASAVLEDVFASNFATHLFNTSGGTVNFSGHIPEEQSYGVLSTSFDYSGTFTFTVSSGESSTIPAPTTKSFHVNTGLLAAIVLGFFIVMGIVSATRFRMKQARQKRVSGQQQEKFQAKKGLGGKRAAHASKISPEVTSNRRQQHSKSMKMGRAAGNQHASKVSPSIISQRDPQYSDPASPTTTSPQETPPIIGTEGTGGYPITGAGATVIPTNKGTNIPVQAGATKINIGWPGENPVDQPDTNYAVRIKASWDPNAWPSDKTTSGFVINFKPAPSDATIDWEIVR